MLELAWLMPVITGLICIGMLFAPSRGARVYWRDLGWLVGGWASIAAIPAAGHVINNSGPYTLVVTLPAACLALVALRLTIVDPLPSSRTNRQLLLQGTAVSGVVALWTLSAPSMWGSLGSLPGAVLVSLMTSLPLMCSTSLDLIIRIETKAL